MRRRTTNSNINFIPTKHLYLSDDRLDVSDLFHRIRMGRRCGRMYLITLSPKEDELFEIYSSKELLLPFYDGKIFLVAGIGKGRRQTLELLEQMIMAVYKDTDCFDVDHYFLS